MPMKIFCYCLLFLAFLSCEVKIKSSSEDKGNEKARPEKYTRNTTKIRNGIELITNGNVKVDQAFLIYGDDGSLVDEQNITELNRQIKMVLIVDGWKEENGKVYLEASEQVTASTGEKIMDINNLFSENNIESLSPKDARELRLSVTISEINRLVDHFLVEFYIWNKKAEQSIKGSYKFHLDKM